MKPKYLIVLIWSFRTEVIKQEKQFIENGGKLIFPLPVFHVVDRENYKKYLKKILVCSHFLTHEIINLYTYF